MLTKISGSKVLKIRIKGENTLVLFLFCISLSAFGQKPFPADYDGIAAVVQLDSFVIMDQQKGFDVEAFISIVQQDESFYQAFKNLHFFNYKAQHEMAFFSRKGDKKAEYSANTEQIMLSDSCRSMEFLAPSTIQGDFYKKNGEYHYTTAQLYDLVFLTNDTICEKANTQLSASRGLQKYYQALKTFIFQPGERVDVPIVGRKTAIFEPEMMKYYNYEIRRDLYAGQIDSYVFTIQVKDAFVDRKGGKTLVKFLETYFRVEDFQVLGRSYEIAYRGLASCDVKMEVDLSYYKGIYLPKSVKYQGTWNIPGKKRETGRFEARFMEFN